MMTKTESETWASNLVVSDRRTGRRRIEVSTSKLELERERERELEPWEAMSKTTPA
jgi:hypothetical protein